MPGPSFDRGAERRSAPLRLRLLSDERLARRVEKGDRRAFAALWRRHRQPLYRFCLAMTGSPPDAARALRDTRARAERALETQEPRIGLKPWLYRIARNETATAARQALATAELEPAHRQLLADLDQLPRQQRAVLVMRELSGLDFVQIGAAFGMPADTAAASFREAQTKLCRLQERREHRAALAALPALPLAGGGSGLVGTALGALGEAAGTSVAIKATATVAVVAATGLSVAGRERGAEPTTTARDGGSGTSWTAPPRGTGAAVSAVAARRSVANPKAPFQAEPTLSPGKPRAAGGADAADLGETTEPDGGSPTPAIAQEAPVVEQAHLTAQPQEGVSVPTEEAAPDPYEAAASETNSDPQPGSQMPVDSAAEEPIAEPEPEPPAMPPAQPPTEGEPPGAPSPPPSWGGGSPRRPGEWSRGRGPRHRR